MSDLLTVPDDDDTRLGLIHAFAYAEGIRREDVPRVSAEARRRWESRADRALTDANPDRANPDAAEHSG